MDNLAPRIRDLVGRLSGGKEPRPDVQPPLGGGGMEARGELDPAALESTYCQSLHRWFELTALGQAADQAEVAHLHQELLRLMDEVGESRATALRRQWAREWWEETGVCPFCGEQGPYHEPERGGDPSGERSPLEGE